MRVKAVRKHIIPKYWTEAMASQIWIAQDDYTSTPGGFWTHELTLHLALTSKGGTIWARAHWHDLLSKKHGHRHWHNTTRDTAILKKLGHDTIGIQQLIN